MAQIVSLDMLKQLAKTTVSEKEQHSQFFEQFKSQYEQTYRMLKQKYKGDPLQPADASYPGIVYAKLKGTFLKDNCPPIRFISEGSSRAAYALEKGFCLKIAMSDAGISQNTAEVKNIRRMPKAFPCFTQLYDQMPKNEAILVECIAECKSEADVEAAAVMLDCESAQIDLLQYIADVLKRILDESQRHRSNWQKASQQVMKNFDQLLSSFRRSEKLRAYRDIVHAIAFPKTPAQQTLRNLAKFAVENPDDLLIGDLAAIDNWGFALRDNQVVPIVLDAGFSREVAQRFY